jgi:hypothetical protein
MPTDDTREAREAWLPGFPPGHYYDGMTDDFEVDFTAGGLIWHRRKGIAARDAATKGGEDAT